VSLDASAVTLGRDASTPSVGAASTAGMLSGLLSGREAAKIKFSKPWPSGWLHPSLQKHVDTVWQQARVARLRAMVEAAPLLKRKLALRGFALDALLDLE